ncbi:unnamed protein product, partial [Symbiodinium pilosum]
MEMGSVGDFAEYMRNYAANPAGILVQMHLTGCPKVRKHSRRRGELSKTRSHKSDKAKAVSFAAEMPVHEAQDGPAAASPEARPQDTPEASPLQPQLRGSKEPMFPGPSVPMPSMPLPASTDQPEIHALEQDPTIERAEVEAAEETLRAVTALKQLQQAAKDGSYAQWTLRRHGLPSTASEESQRRAEELKNAMAQLRQVTQQPLTQQNMKDFENAGRTASDAINRLQAAETEALRKRATEAKRQLLEGAKGWVAGIERQAKNPQLAMQAKEAGAQLEKSLTAALSQATQHTAEASLRRAGERRALLMGVISQAADMAAPGAPAVQQ